MNKYQYFTRRIHFSEKLFRTAYLLRALVVQQLVLVPLARKGTVGIEPEPKQANPLHTRDLVNRSIGERSFN